MSITNRLKRGLGAALVAAVVAAFAAAPAGAKGGGIPNLNAGPNPCIGTFVSDFVPGVGAKEAAALILGLSVPDASVYLRQVCGRAQ